MKSAIALLTASAVLASTTAEDPSITRRRVASDGAKPMKGSARRWRRVQAPNKGLQKKISNDLAPHRLGDYDVPPNQNGNDIVFNVDGGDLQQLQQSMPIAQNNFDFDGKPSMKGSEAAEGTSSGPPGTKEQAASKGGGAAPAPAPEPAGGPAGEPANEPAGEPAAEPAKPAEESAAEPASETDAEISTKEGGGGTEGLEFASESDLDGTLINQELKTSDNGSERKTASMVSVVGGALLMAL